MLSPYELRCMFHNSQPSLYGSSFFPVHFIWWKVVGKECIESIFGGFNQAPYPNDHYTTWSKKSWFVCPFLFRKASQLMSFEILNRFLKWKSCWTLLHFRLFYICNKWSLLDRKLFQNGGPTWRLYFTLVTFKNHFFPFQCHYWGKIALIILQLYI